MNSKMFLTALTAMAGATAMAAVPVVSGTTMQQTGNSVVITYNLTDAPAIVTLDIQTNSEAGVWTSIGGENIQNIALGSDVFKEVEVKDSYTIRWRLDKSWSGHKIADGGVRAVVTAWALDNPPDYAVVDMTKTNSIAYYPSAEFLPGGLLGNPAYRTSSLVFRRIHATNVPWTMGSIFEKGRFSNETAHTVTMDHDYYMGVFEVTQAQYALMTGGSTPSYFKTDGAMRPVESITYVNIRQKAAEIAPEPNSAIDKLRKLTKVMTLELPSEAEWEFACRAGNGEGRWGNGAPYLGIEVDPNQPDRNHYNGGMVIVRDETNVVVSTTEPTADCTPEHGTAIVGSYPPNAWGIYDMHGNVAEWCIDQYKDVITDNADGHAVTGGGNRTVRGGWWKTKNNPTTITPAYARAAFRQGIGYAYSDKTIGFRLVLPIGTK